MSETTGQSLDYGPIQPGSGRGRKLRERAAGIGTALVALLAKGKAILLLLPKLKLLATFGSAFVSIAAYALLWGWAFAAGFVALLFLHELGHVIQLRREGVKASAPMFIPFLGAVITARSMGDDAAAEARVGLAGPILGALASLVPLAIWLVGLAALVAITIAFPNPILILILIFGGIESWRRWKSRKTPEARAYHSIPTRTRVLVAVTYLGLAAALGVGVAETFLSRGIG